MLTDEKLVKMQAEETDKTPWNKEKTRRKVSNILLDQHLTDLAIHLGEYYQYLLREDIPSDLSQDLVTDLQYHLLDEDFLTK